MVILRVQKTGTANAKGKGARMAQTESVPRILTQNQGRDPERLQRKYAAMRRDPFTFLRGTCHLFYADWPQTSPLNDAPATWLCGDIHFENFGSYNRH